jgi:hypothetical protein
MNTDRKTRSWVPPLLIVAAPAGTYTLIRFGPEHGWDTSGLAALAALLLVLTLPQLAKAGAKAVRPRAKKTTGTAKK